MKIALCFIISYDHILNKEDIWKKWIAANNDIINVYFYYKDLNKIKSQWILNHALPDNFIEKTDYFHIIPAYTNLILYAKQHDISNEWFCFLTDSCCPIISPSKFRYLFYNYFHQSIFNWKPAWWNVQLQPRANLYYLKSDYRLANDPYFILCKKDTENFIKFKNIHKKVFRLVSNGDVANESIFAVALKYMNQLDTVIKQPSHLMDWSRMMSPTSPYLFQKQNQNDITFIEQNLINNKFCIFIRKIHPDYPDNILNYYIYQYNKKNEAFLFIFDIRTFYLFLFLFLFLYLTFPSISTLYT